MAKQNPFCLEFSGADRARVFKLIGVCKVGHFVRAQQGFCGKFGPTLLTNVFLWEMVTLEMKIQGLLGLVFFSTLFTRIACITVAVFHVMVKT